MRRKPRPNKRLERIVDLGDKVAEITWHRVPDEPGKRREVYETWTQRWERLTGIKPKLEPKKRSD